MTAYFWVGGTGTWGATNTQFATSSGGSPTASTPGSGDTVTLDASSGGGTVTVNTNFTITTLTMDAFTGTLDFSANNNSPTMGAFSCSGASTKTLNLGNGLWTITGSTGTVWNFGTSTNLTLNPGTGTVKFKRSGNATANMTVEWPQNSVVNAGAGVVWPNVIFDTVTSGIVFFYLFNAPSFSRQFVNNLTFNGGCVPIQMGCSLTVNTALTANGTGFNSAICIHGNDSLVTLPNNTNLNWCVLSDLVFTGTGLTATNSVNLGGNTGITITGPSGGGGIIGC